MEFRKDIDCLVFDFDGTLTHLDIDWTALKQRIGVPISEKLADALPQLNSAAIAKIEQTEVNAAVPLSNEVIDVLAKLYKHYDIVIYSRNAKAAIEKSMKDFLQARQITILDRDPQFDKPDISRLNRYLETHKIDPASTLVIGDTFHDVDAAHKLGAESVIVHNPNLKFQPEGADHYIDDLQEIFAILEVK